MRFNFRLKIRNLTFFAMVAKTQTLEGVTSLQKNGKHFPMWDIEGCTLKEAEITLLNVQRKYCLSDIFITSDKEKSYRAWCFYPVDFKTFLKILLDTDHIDHNYFDYTVKRERATLRTGNKKGRNPQEIVSVLKSYPQNIPVGKSIIQKVVYDTGIEKKGISLLIGGE